MTQRMIVEISVMRLDVRMSPVSHGTFSARTDAVSLKTGSVTLKMIAGMEVMKVTSVRKKLVLITRYVYRYLKKSESLLFMM